MPPISLVARALASARAARAAPPRPRLAAPPAAAPRLLSGAAGAPALGHCRRTLAAARPAAAQWAGASSRGLAAAAAPPPPPAEPLRVFVKRSVDAAFVEVEVGAGASVAALTEAAAAKLRVDAPLGSITLTREGASAPLDGTLSVSASVASGALAPGAKLFLVVHAPAPPAGEATAVARYAAPDLSLIHISEPTRPY